MNQAGAGSSGRQNWGPISSFEYVNIYSLNPALIENCWLFNMSNISCEVIL